MNVDNSHVVNGKLRVPYNNWYGALVSAFFIELRNQRRLRATRCSSCNKVYMPPRSLCPACLRQLHAWVDLPSTGTLVSYTIVHYNYGDYWQTEKAPYALGIIRLDGSDTGMCHFLGDVKFEEIRIGMKVEAVLRKECKGNIRDIAYFRPL
jgi:uncharacterized OB-fold protein